MFDGDRVKMVLSLEAEGPIRGTINAAPGAEHYFHGWMELAGAIDRARRVGATGGASGPMLVNLKDVESPGRVRDMEPS